MAAEAVAAEAVACSPWRVFVSIVSAPWHVPYGCYGESSASAPWATRRSACSGALCGEFLGSARSVPHVPQRVLCAELPATRSTHSQHSLATLTRNTHSQHSLATLTRSTHPQRSLAALVAPTCRAHTVANFSAMQARSGGAPACTEPSIPCQCTWLRWRAAAAAVRHETVPNFFVRHARCVAPLWRCTRVHRDPGQLLGGISSVRARRVQLAAHKKTSTLKNYAVAVCRF